jgi:hypothetical protein
VSEVGIVGQGGIGEGNPLQARELGHGATVVSVAMVAIASGSAVFAHAPVEGRLVVTDGADDVLDLMVDGADDVIVLVRDAGATFLSPIFPELLGVVCTGGTPASHVGIVSREFQVPCAMGVTFDGDPPPTGTRIVLDCSDATALVRLAGSDPVGAPVSAGAGPAASGGSSPQPLLPRPQRLGRTPPDPALLVRGAPVTGDERKAEANRLIAYHEPITRALTVERTSYHSQLIPVTPYILVACVETWYRYPEMMRAIDAAMPAETIAAAGHRPGSRINSVHYWSIANFYLTGRKVLTAMDPSLDDADAAYSVLDFWERGAMAFRHGDGTRQAWDADDVVRPYGPDVIAELVDGVVPVTTSEHRDRIKRFNATLRNYLFLLYFDTRIGTGDSGPYPLPDGRVLLVRDFYQLGPSDYWWSDVAEGMPYQHLVSALVLDGVDVHVTDFGSATTTPEDYLDHVVGFSLFTTDGGGTGRALRPVDLGEIDGIADFVAEVNVAHYRNVVAMSRDEKIRCGAFVYFGFLKPFAEVAGVAGDLDWTVPVATEGFLYELLSSMDGDTLPDIDPNSPYFDPIP